MASLVNSELSPEQIALYSPGFDISDLLKEMEQQEQVKKQKKLVNQVEKVQQNLNATDGQLKEDEKQETLKKAKVMEGLAKSGVNKKNMKQIAKKKGLIDWKMSLGAVTVLVVGGVGIQAKEHLQEYLSYEEVNEVLQQFQGNAQVAVGKATDFLKGLNISAIDIDYYTNLTTSYWNQIQEAIPYVGSEASAAALEPEEPDELSWLQQIFEATPATSTGVINTPMGLTSSAEMMPKKTMNVRAKKRKKKGALKSVHEV